MSVVTGKLGDSFAVLKPDLTVETVKFTPTMFDELDANFDGFKSHSLVSLFEFSEDWPTWERHPAGEEVVVLLSGQATMVLRLASGDSTLELAEPGAFVVVPRNTWHTAKVSTSTRMLFITPGEGTENSATPAPD